MTKPTRKPSRISSKNGTAGTVPDASKRRAVGRPFQKGNQAAKGRSSRRQRLETALQTATSEKDIRDIAGRLKKQALSGSLKAIELFFAYTLGKPRTMDATASGLDLGALSNLRECGQATAKITAAAASGEVQLGEAMVLAELVESARAAHESIEIEQRLALLEERLGGTGGRF